MTVEPCYRALQRIDLVNVAPSALPMPFIRVTSVCNGFTQTSKTGKYLIGKERGHRVVLTTMNDQQWGFHPIKVEDRRIFEITFAVFPRVSAHSPLAAL